MITRVQPKYLINEKKKKKEENLLLQQESHPGIRKEVLPLIDFENKSMKGMMTWMAENL